MKTKFITGILGATLMMAMVMPVHAQEMAVEYTQDNEYTVTIPETITLLENAECTANITSTAMNIAPSKTLKVKVKDGIQNGKATLARTGDTSTTVTSTVSLTSGSTTGIGNNEVVATFAGIDTAVTSGGKLYFSALPNSLKAGTYTGTITFEMVVE